MPGFVIPVLVLALVAAAIGGVVWGLVRLRSAGPLTPGVRASEVQPA